MIARWAQPGRVDWIGLRPARLALMKEVDKVQVTLAGLDGDRGRAGKRAVTLMQHEHLDDIASFLGRDILPPPVLRRNLLVSGLNLAGLKGRKVAVGDTVVRITTVCAPCSRMEEALGHGGYAAVRGHGGWCAEVLSPGMVQIGDAVRPLD